MYSCSVAETTSQSRSSTSCGRLKIASYSSTWYFHVYQREKREGRKTRYVSRGWKMVIAAPQRRSPSRSSPFIAVHLSNEERKHGRTYGKRYEKSLEFLLNKEKVSLHLRKVSMMNGKSYDSSNKCIKPKAYRSVILVARAFLAAWKLSQIAENVQLMMGDLDILFEEDPSNAFVARRRRQRAQVRPVAIIVWTRKEKKI